MSEPGTPDRKVVLGLGNLLNRDEGLGVHALRALERRLGAEPGLELVDGGVLGLKLLPLVEACSHLLVLDAVDAGREPGAVVELARDQIPLLAGVKLSEHQVTFQEVLGLALIRDRLPGTLQLVGAQPADLEIGLELSPVVAVAIPRIVERALEVLSGVGCSRAGASMRRIRLIDAGSVPPIRSQTIYHAAARAMGPETPDSIIVVSPSSPYVCIGFHQDLEQEVDLAFCRAHGLPVVRREVGGGAVYLDAGQVFLQWILHEEHLPPGLEAQFALYVRPLVETYRALGIPAEFRPVNDVHVSGKKIGGTGAAQIGLARVLVGSLMFDFDKRTMARVLKVPSEKMRDKVFASLEGYMTTMRELLPELPPREEVTTVYLERCAEALDAEIVPGAWTDEEDAVARRLDEEFLTPEWLERGGRSRAGVVKIHEGVRVAEGAFKAPGGLVRVVATLRDHRVDDVTFSGDFTILPATGLQALEGSVLGAALDTREITERLEEVYGRLDLRSPGLGPSDFAEAIVHAAAG